MKLTEKIIEEFQYEGPAPRRDIRWDDDVKGLGVRIYPGGKKTFVLMYRFHGRKRLMVLIKSGNLDLKDARKRANKLLVGVGDGSDPLHARQRAEREGTIKELCSTYIDDYAKQHKRSWKADEARLNRHIVKRWGNHKVSDIKRADVSELHGKVGKTKGHYEANRLLAVLSVMFKLAATDFGLLDEGAPNPAHGIKKFREEKRDRYVEPHEFPQLARAINETYREKTAEKPEEGNPYVRAALWLYLLTGARKTELLNAKWADINLDAREWTIPETKAGRKHRIPLSAPALALLNDLPRQKGNPYVLPGARKERPLVNIAKPWNRVRDVATVRLWAAMDGEPVAQLIADLTRQLDREPTYDEVRKAATFDLPAGLRDVRLHDLRRTAGSWLAQAGNSLHLIGKVLNHSNVSTTQVYARFGQDNVRQALEQHGERIWNAGHEQKADVVPIKQGKG